MIVEMVTRTANLKSKKAIVRFAEAAGWLTCVRRETVDGFLGTAIPSSQISESAQSKGIESSSLVHPIDTENVPKAHLYSGLMFQLSEEQATRAKVAIIGVGGGGGNAINTMIAAGMTGVKFIAANTDHQMLERSLAQEKLQLGIELTSGLGAGGNPDIGREAALGDAERIASLLNGLDMVFVTAGMGGGTGTGAAPVIARIAKEAGILTVGVVTKPFDFEGPHRQAQAEQGIAELHKSVNTLITIPNQRLLGMTDHNTFVSEVFQKSSNIILEACKGILDLITTPGLINLDFADVRVIMRDMGGLALIGTGVGTGGNRAVIAAQNAISSPLLEEGSIQGARGVLINITGGNDLSLFEVNEACSLIHGSAHEDANIIFGSVIDPAMENKVRVTVIATGFGRESLREITRAEVESTDVRKLSVPAYVRIKVKKKGLVRFAIKIDEETDVPTLLRRSS